MGITTKFGGAFPDWESRCLGITKNEDGTYTTLEQQVVKAMKADTDTGRLKAFAKRLMQARAPCTSPSPSPTLALALTQSRRAPRRRPPLRAGAFCFCRR